MSHAGMAALVGSTELRGMVDPVELVFAERALRPRCHRLRHHLLNNAGTP